MDLKEVQAVQVELQAGQEDLPEVRAGQEGLPASHPSLLKGLMAQ